MSNGTDFYLLIDDDGLCLRADGSRASTADDAAMWTPTDLGWTSATVPDVAVDGSGLTVREGPTRLPSEHLTELRDRGLTVVERLLDPTTIERLKRRAYRELARQQNQPIESDDRVHWTNALAWSPDIARAATNPVAIWVLERYLGTPDIHCCHPAGLTAMRPTKNLLGTFPEEGWHCDYPYHPNIFPDNFWPEAPVYGVQFNICIDAFRPDNAATQYVPQSHRLRAWPPREYSLGGTRMGVGQHQDVQQMTAPAGSALLYDARTWHRACNELNTSGADRFALLNAVAPDWVVPLGAKAASARRYRASNTPAQLSARERRDIDRFYCRPTRPTPTGQPQLVRPELPTSVRDRRPDFLDE